MKRHIISGSAYYFTFSFTFERKALLRCAV